MNPNFITDKDIIDISQILLSKLATNSEPLESIYFYGAGCSSNVGKEKIKLALTRIFPDSIIDINTDILGACIGSCGTDSGIVGILGTGSNSCLFDGEKITDNTPALGYILGDEGSGAHLGRQLLSDCIKKQLPKDICEKFFKQYNLDIATILEKTYHSSLPNRWLASFTPFLKENKEKPEIKMLLKHCFTQFFQRNTMIYRRSWLPIHIIGSVGVNFSEEIKETAESLGLSIGNIVDSPMSGLIEYHKQNN